MNITKTELRDLHDKLDFILKDYRVLLKKLTHIETLAKRLDKLERKFESYKTTQSRTMKRRELRNKELVQGVQKATTALARSQTSLARKLLEDPEEYIAAQRRDFYNERDNFTRKS